jgi:hypothetical protein
MAIRCSNSGDALQAVIKQGTILNHTILNHTIFVMTLDIGLRPICDFLF